MHHAPGWPVQTHKGCEHRHNVLGDQAQRISHGAPDVQRVSGEPPSNRATAVLWLIKPRNLLQVGRGQGAGEPGLQEANSRALTASSKSSPGQQGSFQCEALICCSSYRTVPALVTGASPIAGHNQANRYNLLPMWSLQPASTGPTHCSQRGEAGQQTGCYTCSSCPTECFMWHPYCRQPT